MENVHSQLLSPEKAAEILAQKRATYDAILEEIRIENATRDNAVTRERGEAVIRIAAQGE
jgi:hypothetical protein